MDEYKDLKPKEEFNISKKECISKNIKNFDIFDFNDFENNLNISDIKDEIKKAEEDKTYKTKKDVSSKIYINQNIDKDFSVDLDNINEDEFNNERKISLCSLQSEEFSCHNNNLNCRNLKRRVSLFNKKESKKITKEDLNFIPLPVFSCIYCSNDKISFKHLSQEIISNNYLFQSSIYDILELNKLIVYQPILDKDDKNEKLLDIIIKNTEYINKYFLKNNINQYFQSNNYLDLCKKEILNNNRNFKHRIEDSVIKKKKDFYFRGIKKIPKNSLNNKCLFNTTNSLINNYNAFSGFVEAIPINNNNINIGKIINNNISNISLNFNSISSNNNETGNYLSKDKDNNNLLVSLVGKIEKNVESINETDDDKEEIMDFFKDDLERKIKKEDINWENNYYDIWNPNIEDDDLESEHRKKSSKIHLLKSSDKVKIKRPNNSYIHNINKTLSISQMKSICSTNNSTEINYENDNKIKSNIFNHTNDSSINNKNSNLSSIMKKIKINDNFKKLINFKENIKNSKNNKTPISLKINKLLIQFQNNDFINIEKDIINESNIINSNISKIENNTINTNNESHSNSSTLKYIGNKVIPSNIKYTKSNTKSFCMNKVNIKKGIMNKSNEIKKIKVKYLPNKINCYISNSNLNTNLNLDRVKTTPTPYTRNEGTKIISSKIKYKQNTLHLNNSNDGYPIIKSSRKKLNISKNFSTNYSNSKKKTQESSNKVSEISRVKKNIYYARINYQKLNDNNVNSIIVSNKKPRLSKSNNNKKSGVIIRRNYDNLKLNISHKNNNNIKKNLMFVNSLMNNSASKIITINKKFL